MKFIVTEMPSKPDDCFFYKVSPDTRKGECGISRNRDTCKIGEDGFTCPYLQKFKANMKEQIQQNTFKVVPITLEEE